MKRIAIAFILILAGTCWSVTLPVDCDFNADTPELPPATGADNQPTSLLLPGAGSILVKSEALGLTDQPCLIDQAGSAAYGSINFLFDSVSEDCLVFEATISVNMLCGSYLMQTASAASAVISRLRLLDDGSIVDYFLTPLGSYAPGVPFRCRMSVNLVDENWDCVIDDELNGFADDPISEDLPYVNDASAIDDVGMAMASLGQTPGGVAQAAYDDILISVVEITATADRSWSYVKRSY